MLSVEESALGNADLDGVEDAAAKVCSFQKLRK